MTTTTVAMTVNGKQVSADVENRTLLVQYLRESLGLTGTPLPDQYVYTPWSDRNGELNVAASRKQLVVLQRRSQFQQFPTRLPQSQHQTGFGGHVGTDLGKACEQLQRVTVICAGTHASVETGNGF